jgi:hypothetical protein
MSLVGANVRSVMESGRGRLKGDEGEMQLPFEELDPCCQKEIVNENHHARVNAQLKKNDRTLQRLEVQKKAIDSLRKGFGCICGEACDMTGYDYPLLTLVRASVAEEPPYEGGANGYMGKAELDPAEDRSDSDDDSLLNDLADDFLTSEEKVRLEEAKKLEALMEKAKGMGFACHIEEDLGHFRQLIRSKQTVILHVYEPSSMLCARLDLLFERLAATYIGTKFRRIAVSPNTSHFLESELDKGISATSQSLHPRLQGGLPCLVAFKEGAVSLIENDLSQFGNNDSAFEGEVTKYLSHAHLLSTELVLPSFEALLNRGEEEEEAEEGGDGYAGSYCSFPGCTRGYNHSHVAAGADSLVKDDRREQGMEALADNIFTKL